MSITLEKINKSYENKKILNDLSLKINDKETTVVVGPSGSGKSTFLRCLNALEIPESGTITVEKEKINFGQKTKEKQLVPFRKKTGMVFQGFFLFPHLTVIENVIEGPVYVLKKNKIEAIESATILLEKVGLADKLDNYPSQLSGGQQQRVAIARALAMNPYFLLFDEPTSALDPELETEVLKVIKSLSDLEKSLIIVTHNMEFARKIADRIIFIEEGQFLFDGTSEEFFSSKSDRIKKFINSMEYSN